MYVLCVDDETSKSTEQSKKASPSKQAKADTAQIKKTKGTFFCNFQMHTNAS